MIFYFYVIQTKKTKNFYVGYTKLPKLSTRFQYYKNTFKHYQNTHKRFNPVFKLLKDDYYSCSIRLLEEFTCDTREEVKKKHKEILLQYDNKCLNNLYA